MEFIIQFIGYMLLWAATDIGRGPESEVKIFSGDWWIVCGLIAIGVVITGYESTPN